MDLDILEYARSHLEDELYICDNQVLDLDVDLSEHPYAEMMSDYVELSNPKFIQGKHDSPFYRAFIASELNKVIDLMEGR